MKSMPPEMINVCMRYSGNRSIAEETMQEGFLIIFSKIGQLKDSHKLGSWIKQIMINSSLKKLRKKEKLIFLSDELLEEHGRPYDIFYLNDNSVWVTGSGGLTAIYDYTVGHNDYTINSKNLIIYPNPAADHINIELTNKHDEIERVEIYSISGTKVYANNHFSLNNIGSIDISSLKSGTYIVRVESNNEIRLTKLVLR